ncbi:hypothetical protein Ancab_006258 [Ancistrocladus abbreviatus]
MGQNFIAPSNWNCGRRSICDQKCGFSSIYWIAEQMSICLNERDRAELLNKGMDKRKKLQNKQAALQGGANFPNLWQTARHRPPSMETTTTHLELSFLKKYLLFLTFFIGISICLQLVI